MASKGVTRSQMGNAIEDIQKLIKDENTSRIESSKDTDWDLVTQIIIREDSLILETESLIMSYEEGWSGKARITKRKKFKRRGDDRG